jgi:hypothetical protein
MTFKANMERPASGFLRIRRAAARIALPAGAAGSVGLMLYAGRHNGSRLLLALFALWVSSPFIALGLASAVAKRWSVPTRAALDWLTLALTVGSLSIYGYVAFGPPRAKVAPLFVVVPPVSCVLIAVVISMTALISGRRAYRRDGNRNQL